MAILKSCSSKEKEIFDMVIRYSTVIHVESDYMPIVCRLAAL